VPGTNGGFCVPLPAGEVAAKLQALANSSSGNVVVESLANVQQVGIFIINYNQSIK